MAERVSQTTGLAVDWEHLRKTTKPDPLGEEVSPTLDGVHKVSYLLPFVRLIKQNRKGVSYKSTGYREKLLWAGIDVRNSHCCRSATNVYCFSL